MERTRRSWEVVVDGSERTGTILDYESDKYIFCVFWSLSMIFLNLFSNSSAIPHQIGGRPSCELT